MKPAIVLRIEANRKPPDAEANGFSFVLQSPARAIRVARGMFRGLMGIVISYDRGDAKWLVRLDGFSEGVYFVLPHDALEFRLS
jgi:hypothetical protein